MSLIPYHAREGREIVLRHHNAIVVRDPDSQRLEIRRGECPTCHQPLGRSPSPDRHRERQFDLTKEYVDPEYFRMLRAGLSSPGPCSPVRRLVPPALAGSSSTSTSGSGPSALGEEAEFALGSSGACQDEGSRIRRDAFSPNYFKTFFVEETTLGRGGKGVVLLVRHEIDGCQLGHFACKRVPVGNDHTWLEKVLIEVELLAKLSHPNLVSYRHAWLEDVKLTRFGPSVVCAFILQQYCNGGDLHQYVVGSAPREATKEELKAQIRRRSKGQADPPRDLRQGRPQLSFEDIYSLFKDITSGVAYLHAANYIHRDLKPSNCLLHNEGGKLTCLISDFGEVQPENMARNSTGSTGTISYCAPEVLKMDSVRQYGNFTTKSDMFSLGMILYFMCFGRLPYQGANAIQEELEDLQLLRSEIIGWEGFQDERRERPDLPTRLYKLLKKLLALEPAERPGANEVLAAMRSETSFDGITWGERVSATSRVSRGIRVQNLDSPAAPSTPDLAQTEGSWKQAAVQDESGPWPKLGDRGSAMMQLGDKATQTLPRPGVSQRRGRTQSRLVDDARTGRDGHDEQTTGPDELFSPPLLMAPPRSRLAEMAFHLKLACHRLVAVIVVGWDLFGCVARLGFFLLKLGTLTRSCWPYAVSIEVSVPLVIVASLDLGLSRGRLSKPLNGGRIQARYDAISNTGLFCGLRASLLLLALHFTVLWLARQWNSLCVGAARDSWAD